MTIFEVKYGQTIFDIAVQLYGDIEGIEYILRDNQDIDLGTELNVGQEINIDETLAIDRTIIGYFGDRKYIITNDEKAGEFTAPGAEPLYWTLEDGSFVTDEKGNKIIIG